MKNSKRRLGWMLPVWVVAAGFSLQSCGEVKPTMQMDQLNRGVVAVRETPENVFVSWRYLSTDPMNTSFNVYRDGQKIAEVPANQGTHYKDTYS